MNAAEPGPERAFDTDEARWQAVSSRQASADGSFVYAVATTGVYCRPSCAARAARRENVSFHRTPADAEAAGFRPCKRCRPDGRSPAELRAEAVARACRLIDEAESRPRSTISPERPASAALLPPRVQGDRGRHAESVRRRAPPCAGADRAARRAERDGGDLWRGLQREQPLLRERRSQARHDPVRLPQRRPGQRDPLCGRRMLARLDPGRSLRQRCARSSSATIQTRWCASFRTASEGTADRRRRCLRAAGCARDRLRRGAGAGSRSAARCARHAFQQRVWQALRNIPAGSTASYAEIARHIGQPKAVRAVAQACASNAIAVAIPCHRVVRNDGALSGYRWGVERKRALLEKELAA